LKKFFQHPETIRSENEIILREEKKVFSTELFARNFFLEAAWKLSIKFICAIVVLSKRSRRICGRALASYFDCAMNTQLNISKQLLSDKKILKDSGVLFNTRQNENFLS